MTEPQAIQILNALFVSVWPTPFALDNEAIAEPDTGSWATVYVQGIDDRQDSLGGIGTRRMLRRRIFTIRVRTPRDQGLSPMTTLGKLVTDTFGNFSSGETLWVVDITPRSQGYDGRCRVVDFEVAFNFHEIR